MSSLDDVGDDAIYGICRTIPETIVVVNHLHGAAVVESLIVELMSVSTREAMRKDADELARVGLQELASLVRRYARKAKPGRKPFGPGFQTTSALAVIERRRAEARLLH
jgi:hypothetical protein